MKNSSKSTSRTAVTGNPADVAAAGAAYAFGPQAAPVDPNNPESRNTPDAVDDVESIVLGVNSTETGNILTNDKDDDGDSFFLVQFKNEQGYGTFDQPLQGTYGQLTLSSDGIYSYVADPLLVGSATNVSDVFSYIITDDIDGSDGASLTFNISGSNPEGGAAPIAVDDVETITEGRNETETGNVLTNDNDPDGDSIFITGFAKGETSGTFGQELQGTYGKLTLNSDGSYTYVADSDLIGTLTSNVSDVFSYEITDDVDGSDSATLTFNIVLANDNHSYTVKGRNGHQTLYGDQVAAGDEDTLLGGNDGDTLYGYAGADVLKGNNGNDTLFGGRGRDQLFGNNGNDILFGEEGNDVLVGEAGNDRMDGGNGGDLLAGGAGDDRLTGGAGKDAFVFGRTGGNDTVTDFRVGADVMILDGIKIKSITERDVDRDGDLDTVVAFTTGTATLLDVSGVTAGQLTDQNLAALHADQYAVI